MQLKIFSGKVSKSLAVGQRKRTAKTIRPTYNQGGFDLWSQGTDGEREMALLFLDIRNFTPLIEAYGAVDTIHIIKKLLVNFQNVIRMHHGRIIETTGDGFYAAFGFDRNIKDAANDAVASGMAILKNLDILNRTSFEEKLDRKIEAGIGIHTGKVATGTIRLGNEDHLVVMGYPVNVASRLQTATKEFNNNLIISSAVFQLLNSHPAGRTITSKRLKGLSESLQLHLIGTAYYAQQTMLEV
ncbi:MAG TPA: adenylate/guanylate cyclase domain-containing protein [Ohtaekwangia sp.]